ncbi:MAG: hypothetical protein WCK76_09670 [Elusimicrobiota bacterium]
MKKYVLTLLAAGLITGTSFAQEEKAEGPQPFHARSGVVMGPVAAIDAAKNEIIIGDTILKVSAKDIARLKVGDDITVGVHGRKVKVTKAEDNKEPELFDPRGGGVAMGPISAIDPAKNQITMGNNMIKISPKDIARLKVGDDVTVEGRKGRITVRKAGDKIEPEPFNGLTGHSMGPLQAIDSAKNELTVNDTIFKVKPADLAGLNVGDRVKITVTKTGTTVTRLK